MVYIFTAWPDASTKTFTVDLCSRCRGCWSNGCSWKYAGLIHICFLTCLIILVTSSVSTLTLCWVAGRLTNNDNSNNNNKHDDIYGAVIMAKSHCESSPNSFDECRLSTGWLPTLRPSQSTWAVSPPIIAAIIHIHYCHLLSLLSPKVDTHFTIPRRIEGWVDLDTVRRMQQALPKTAYHNGCCNKWTTSGVIWTWVLSYHSQVRYR